MLLNRLELTNTRSFSEQAIDFTPGLSVFVGENGSGKTNLLEAAATSLLGKSPRTSKEINLIKNDQTFARIASKVTVNNNLSSKDVRFILGQGKSLRLDEVAVRSTLEFSEKTPAFVFLPEKLLTMRGAPARRRALIDNLLVTIKPSLISVFKAYTHSLQQRNNLLRAAKVGKKVSDQIEPWSILLAEHGEIIRSERQLLLAEIHDYFANEFLLLTEMNGGMFVTNQRGDDDIKKELDDTFLLDTRRGSTSTGPHLDDFIPHEHKRNLRLYGSTGEQRASLLAFTFASAKLCENLTNQSPIIFLDEPWSELDFKRRKNLSTQIINYEQVICTTTETPNHLKSLNCDSIEIFKISLDKVEKCHPKKTLLT